MLAVWFVNQLSKMQKSISSIDIESQLDLQPELNQSERKLVSSKDTLAIKAQPSLKSLKT